MPSDKKNDCSGAGDKKFSSHDLQHILEVNKKAIELHIETSQQFEEILEHLDANTKTMERINAAITSVEKNLFKLIVILSTIGGGVIIDILRAFFHK